MEILLKKYFWVVNLVVIGICAAFAGRAAGHILEGAYLAGDDIKAPAVRHGPPPPLAKLHDKNGDVVVSRDIFCSGCVPPKPTVSENGPPSNEWTKSTLQLDLVSTMVCPSDDNYSMAVMRDMSTKEKDPEMYHRGSTIGATGAAVYRVTSKRVYILNAGKPEYVDLEGNAPPPVVAQNTPPPAINSEMGDIDKGVNCNGNSCTIDRALVEKLLSNTTMLATAARFVPSIKDGKPNGFKLYAIRPQSIFGRIGLQNGDTIKAINGSEMTTPDAALGLYTKLRNASHLSVQVERRGETVALDYSIR
ncbi:MAG TPA: type II secretion system protein GspC [Polyangia bacterium]|jgi:general secretion pathway protein C